MVHERGVWIDEQGLHIEHAQIEEGLRALAERWGVTPEEALDRALTSACAVLEDDRQATSGA